MSSDFDQKTTYRSEKTSDVQICDLARLIATRIKRKIYTHMELILTTKCNLRCTYCFEKNSDRTRVMDLDVGMEAIGDFLITDLPIRQSIVFFGGEPFLNWPTFSELAKYARRLKPDPKMLHLSTVTNGTVMPAEAMNLLRAANVTVMVSMDMGKVAHDKHRTTAKGFGTFSTVVNNIRRLLEKEIHVVVRSTVCPNSIDKMMETYEICKNLGIFTWYLSRVTGVEWKESEIEDLKVALAELSRVYEKDRANAESSVRIAQLEYIKHGVLLNPCTAGQYGIAIDPDGRVFGCSRLATSSPSSGKFQIGSLRKGIDSEKAKRLHKLVIEHGCPAINYEETGMLTKSSVSERGIRAAFSQLEDELRGRAE